MLSNGSLELLAVQVGGLEHFRAAGHPPIDAREYSFVDAVSFEVMRRQRSTEILEFDGDFSSAGFVEVRP